MLSLSPRYDLFRFVFPKDFLPKELEQKYMKLLNKTPGVITSPIDYLNESIQSVTIPGISDIVITQQQHSSNDNTRGAGRINVEPRREAIYQSTSNPLEKINPEFRVTFRLNQGFYNYFMLYEAIFHQVCKTHNKNHQDILFVELLNEEGEIISRITFYDTLMDGIDGLDFGYDKVDRDSGTFDVTFKFSNINFDFVDEH